MADHGSHAAIFRFSAFAYLVGVLGVRGTEDDGVDVRMGQCFFQIARERDFSLSGETRNLCRGVDCQDETELCMIGEK